MKQRWVMGLAVVVVVILGLTWTTAQDSARTVEEHNIAVTRAVFDDILNRGNFTLERLTELVGEDGYIMHPPPNYESQRMPALVIWSYLNNNFFINSPDYRAEALHIFAEGDIVITHQTESMTYVRSPVQFDPVLANTTTGVTVTRFENGQIEEQWVYSNDPSIWAQVAVDYHPGMNTRYKTDPIANWINGMTAEARNMRLAEEVIAKVWSAAGYQDGQNPVDAYYARGVMYHYPLFNTAPRASGIDEVKVLHAALLAAFPDLKLTPANIRSDSPSVYAHFTLEGTHQNTFEYGGLTVQPTGQIVKVKGLLVFNFTMDGKVAQEWWYLDNPLFPS